MIPKFDSCSSNRSCGSGMIIGRDQWMLRRVASWHFLDPEKLVKPVNLIVITGMQKLWNMKLLKVLIFGLDSH